MTTTTTIAHATPAQPTAKKARRKAVMRYPYQMHCAVTPQMHLALERLGNPLSLLNASDAVRAALHAYLLQYDPIYHQAYSGNG